MQPRNSVSSVFGDDDRAMETIVPLLEIMAQLVWNGLQLSAVGVPAVVTIHADDINVANLNQSQDLTASMELHVTGQTSVHENHEINGTFQVHVFFF